MNIVKKRALVAASVAGLMAAGLAVLGSQVQAADEAGSKVPCYGVNKCKGAGDCGGKGHSCSGQNTCKGQAFLKLEKGTCLKIQGGRLTAEEAKS